MKDGEPVPWPIEDVERVDERRAGVGLAPLRDHHARWHGMTWATSVGFCTTWVHEPTFTFRAAGPDHERRILHHIGA